jgi:catechol 2,3-dioxygenase-like lactoylglutathione lyase family enzyme
VATIDHVTLRVSDLAAALELFTRSFELLGFTGQRYDGAGFHEWNDFAISQADREHEVTRGVHVGFAATSRAQIDTWWGVLTAAGYSEDGAPGPRPEYGSTYYGAFIRDRDNNSIEAVHHESSTPETGLIDHLWIRVADLHEAKRLYTVIAPVVGIRARDLGDRLQLITESGTFSLLEGDPTTENLHLAIGVPDRDTVDTFHQAGLEAGGRNNGSPGERLQYHPGYYGAYLLDPDSNNLEAVFHERDAA